MSAATGDGVDGEGGGGGGEGGGEDGEGEGGRGTARRLLALHHRRACPAREQAQSEGGFNRATQTSRPRPAAAQLAAGRLAAAAAVGRLKSAPIKE